MNINTKTDMIPNHQCDGNEGLRNANNEGNEGKTKKDGEYDTQGSRVITDLSTN